jgi:diaminopimelate epimerase
MSILKNFVKYHSLGNDFVIFDWYKRPSLYMHNELHEASWKDFVIKICNRHFGVGADGVLVVTNCPKASMPEMLVFNADGSPGGNCLNGLRCVTHYLFTHYHFPRTFKIKLGERIIDCMVNNYENKPASYSVVSQVGPVEVHNTLTINIQDKPVTGHVVTIGNPHFIVFEKTNLEWLALHGASIECHEAFSHRTNVEFVIHSAAETKESMASYQVLVFERGSGITLACSSGAAAITGLLHANGSVRTHQKIAIHMPGGGVTTWVNQENSVVLEADAQLVFKGSFEDTLCQAEQVSYTQLRMP